MGTSDETKTLAYGQVFIQYSTEPHHPMINVKTVLGKVVVTKNPCFHPGDLRILEAVDIPGLRHMVDCIVSLSVVLGHIQMKCPVLILMEMNILFAGMSDFTRLKTKFQWIFQKLKRNVLNQI